MVSVDVKHHVYLVRTGWYQYSEPFQPYGQAESRSVWDRVWTVLNHTAMLTHAQSEIGFGQSSTIRPCWRTLSLRSGLDSPRLPYGDADTHSVWDRVWTVLVYHTAMLTHTQSEIGFGQSSSTIRPCWHTLSLRSGLDSPRLPYGHADTHSVWDRVWTVLVYHTAMLTHTQSEIGFGQSSSTIRPCWHTLSLRSGLDSPQPYSHADAHSVWDNNNNNNIHLSCAHQRPERSHDTY